MGLKSLAVKAATLGFRVAGDLIEKSVYASVVDDGINEPVTLNINVGVQYGEFSMMERATGLNIQPGDIIAGILVNQLGVEPRAGDVVTRANGSVFHVIGYTANVAVYRVHLRAA